MGYHTCQYCPAEKAVTCNTDVELTLKNSNVIMVPGMLLHYIRVHFYKPDEKLVKAVMNAEVSTAYSLQYLGTSWIGYLKGDFSQDLSAVTPEKEEFIRRLEAIMTQAELAKGQRITPRYLPVNDFLSFLKPPTPHKVNPEEAKMERIFALSLILINMVLNNPDQWSDCHLEEGNLFIHQPHFYIVVDPSKKVLYTTLTVTLKWATEQLKPGTVDIALAFLEKFAVLE